jgi:hypothetical protein
MVALAASLVLVPATMAAGGALPGQPLYPVKRSVEQVRLAALGWSPAASARERLRLADVRTDELGQLVERGEVGHVPGAVVALRQAVDAATEAVDQASFKDVGSSRSVALRQDLASVQDHQIIQLSSVTAKLPSSSSPAARQAREAANNALVSATRQKAAQTSGGRTATTTTGAPAATPTTGALLPGLATTVTVTTVAAAGAAQAGAGAANAAGPTAGQACGDSPGSSGAPAAARVSSGGPSASC